MTRGTLLVVVGVLFGPTPTWAQVPFSDDFDSGAVAPDWREAACCGHSLQIVSAPDPVRAGNHAVRFELRRGDRSVDLGKRSEISLDRVDPRGEYWYGFSLYLPADYARDRSAEIVAQWHGYPDMSEGENWRSPPLALLTDDGEWRIARRHDARRVTPGNGNDNLVSPRLGSYEDDRGRWVDWAFHVRWSWTGDGFVRIYKDGSMVYEHEGSVGFNDAEGPYLKVGIYKWDWSGGAASDTDERVVYIDEIQVRGADGSLAAVSPGGAPGGSDAGTPSGGDAGMGPRSDAGVPAGSDAGAIRPSEDGGGVTPSDAGTRSADAGVARLPAARAEPASGGCAITHSVADVRDLAFLLWISLFVTRRRHRRGS